MNKFVTENLMLLEFLVDDLYLTAPTKRKIESVKGETNVMFQFLDNRPIIITSKELQASCSGSETRCGKSCLFSMSTEQGIEALGNFLIQIKVFQKFSSGVLPNLIDIACGDVCISELFADLMESAMGSAEKAWVKCQKETVKLYMCGECVGSVSVFIRMSCYGKYIVTQCEMNMGDFQDSKKTICAGKDKKQNQQSKCLPLPDSLVQGAKDTSEAEPPPKRQIGTGEVISEDPCENIIRSETPGLENEVQGDFIGQTSAKGMGVKMLDAPQWDGKPCPQQWPESPIPSAELSYGQPAQEVPTAGYGASTPSYAPPPTPLPSPLPQQQQQQVAPTCVGDPNQIKPCDPCPPNQDIGPTFKEIIPRPPQKKQVVPKPSKDKILFKLAMPKYGPKDDPNCPYQFEFVTPTAWPRESLGRQCRDAQCDCKDFPRGYLESYYGAEGLQNMLREQLAEEMRIEKVYGICPVGQFANVKRPKGGLQELYEQCIDVKVKPPPKGGAGGRGGKGRGGKGKGGKGGKGGGDDDDGGKKNKGFTFKPPRKLQKHGGIEVPDGKPVCGPCSVCPCVVCPKRPCGACKPCPCDAPGGRPCSPSRSAAPSQSVVTAKSTVGPVSAKSAIGPAKTAATSGRATGIPAVPICAPGGACGKPGLVCSRPNQGGIMTCCFKN